MNLTSRAVAVVNRMTGRWAAVCGDSSTTFSAAGAWPLLAFLADAASGQGRRELESALGVSGETASEHAQEVLRILTTSDATGAALGLWTGQGVDLHEDWLSRVGPGLHGELTGDGPADEAALDSWVCRQTAGLIPKMPIEVHADTLLVLASALTVRTRWLSPFTAAGQGVALVPELGTGRLPDGVRLLPLATRRRTRIAYRRGAGEHPAVAACVHAIRAATEEHLHQIRAGEPA